MNPMEFRASDIKVAAIAVGITLVLTLLVLVHYGQISKRPGVLVIPAGNTYLGPNAPKQGTQPTDTTWRDVHGRIYPYVFSAPAALSLKTFDNDPYDIYAIDCCGIDPGSNVLIGLDNLQQTPSKTHYISQSKRVYVQEWWKQFGALKGVTGIDQFTNSKGLKGYKARYFNDAGKSPNLDVFFEIPAHPEYVIHLASGTLDGTLFDTIIDSVAWEQ